MAQTNHSPKPPLRLFLTGFCMGTADLIPGVSGGTVAFVSGIYEELLGSIKTVSGTTLKHLLRFRFKAAFQSVPFRFLVPLALGIGTAILSLANLLGHLLETYPSFVWSFFFGLVIASTWLVGKTVTKWGFADILAFVVATVFAFFLVGSIPVETPTNLLTFFLSGMIAICAMILPGISGSFILLILGKYTQVLDAVRGMDILVLVVFASGCAVGLSLFSRFLTWLFANHHNVSVAALAGFMLGSVRKLWPWQEVTLTRINSHGEVVPLATKNILPGSLSIEVLGIIAIMMVGFILMVFLQSKASGKEEVKK